MSVEEWEAVLQVNLSGPFFMIKAVLESMLERSYGRIVNVSSVVGSPATSAKPTMRPLKPGSSA